MDCSSAISPSVTFCAARADASFSAVFLSSTAFSASDRSNSPMRCSAAAHALASVRRSSFRRAISVFRPAFSASNVLDSSAIDSIAFSLPVSWLAWAVTAFSAASRASTSCLSWRCNSLSSIAAMAAARSCSARLPSSSRTLDKSCSLSRRSRWYLSAICRLSFSRSIRIFCSTSSFCLKSPPVPAAASPPPAFQPCTLENVYPIKGKWLPLKPFGGWNVSVCAYSFGRSTPSKLEVSVALLTGGITGGVICRRLAQSTPLKNGWALISSTPFFPIRLDRSVSSLRIRSIASSDGFTSASFGNLSDFSCFWIFPYIRVSDSS
eukprot:Opistho-2@93404